ncbi:uncharacterized protein LOC101218568 [Cucumis sativus]|uniref:30S ribosomal protein S6 n=1 Tax=Cucumis sativus TaxID=3659 RepID=A0A0A0L2X6_CUCSA|nr:uncharacterized protein LOC101218568 [Cucumis sativus]KGN56093.1 hypothetical protein Csa_010447 [Cucumis sativus]
MPLYDVMFLMKPHVKKEALLDLVARVGKHVFRRNGVVCDIKSFGVVQLGYGIKKLDGRYYQGQLMQMTMMATPNMNKELFYLNKEDRLLRWILVKHRDRQFGLEFLGEDDDKNGLEKLSRLNLMGDDDEDEDEDEDDDDDEEYNVEPDDTKAE